MSDAGTKEIWEDFSIPLKKFIAKRVRNEYDTEDILQEIFCKIHNHIVEVKDKNKLHSWIYQITRNAIIDYYRTRTDTIEVADLPDLDMNTGLLDSEIYHELGACLKAMLLHLPDKYRVAIILAEFEQLPQKEIAKRLGLSLSGAKSRLQRARSKLRELLLGCCYIEFDRLGHIAGYRHKRRTCKFC
ncbi:MAG: rpoE [Anaerosporomusa subterranea]|jgi:RNA polymerase sigma-70 factor (ECF subfamily)|nr:rpoE [Anaerosporomusa subterranea]